MACLELEGVGFSFSERKVLDGIDLQVGEGEFVGIMGLNGSGKTTLLRCMCGIIPKAIGGRFEGRVRVFGDDIRKKKLPEVARQVGMVFQNPDSQLFALTVREEVAFGPENFKLKKEEIGKRVNCALEEVGMLDSLQDDPQSLSFGQKQKIAIASVLVMEPPVLLLDEPFSLLDNPSAEGLFGILKGLKGRGKTVVIIDHRWKRVKEVDRVVVIDGGRIVANGKPAEVRKTEAFRRLKLDDGV